MTNLHPDTRHVASFSQVGLEQAVPVTGFLRQWQVLRYIPISKSTLWRRIQAKTFPQPIKLSTRVTVWRAEQIRDWIMAQSAGDVASASTPSAQASSMRRAAAKTL